MKLAHSLSLALVISTMGAPARAADAARHRTMETRMEMMQATMQMMMDRLPAAPAK